MLRQNVIKPIYALYPSGGAGGGGGESMPEKRQPIGLLHPNVQILGVGLYIDNIKLQLRLHNLERYRCKKRNSNYFCNVLVFRKFQE